MAKVGTVRWWSGLNNELSERTAQGSRGPERIEGIGFDPEEFMSFVEKVTRDLVVPNLPYQELADYAGLIAWALEMGINAERARQLEEAVGG